MGDKPPYTGLMRKNIDDIVRLSKKVIIGDNQHNTLWKVDKTFSLYKGTKPRKNEEIIAKIESFYGITEPEINENLSMIENNRNRLNKIKGIAEPAGGGKRKRTKRKRRRKRRKRTRKRKITKKHRGAGKLSRQKTKALKKILKQQQRSLNIIKKALNAQGTFHRGK